MNRKTALAMIEVAGYHGDKKSFTQLYTENRISMSSAQAAWEIGTAKKRNGVGCGCPDCKRGAK